MHPAQRLINHVALVLDGSSSMTRHTANLIKVADEQIRYLALRSEELSQETRVSVYLFADRVECLIFDMDVMRLPSISDLYRASGMTALIDAAIKSQQDLATTSQIYGDHAFLSFVLTDGAENASRNSWVKLSELLKNAGENWSVGFLVPDRQGQAYLSRLGVVRDATAIWDTQSAKGIADAAATIRKATDTFMTNRAAGKRGTKTVFATVDVKPVKATEVQANLIPLQPHEYALFPIRDKARINDFLRSNNIVYKNGIGYYQLTKEELVQKYKKVIVVDKKTGVAYQGDAARNIIGLPLDKPAKVRPTAQPDYDIYIQSTSPTRNLLPGTQLLVKA